MQSENNGEKLVSCAISCTRTHVHKAQPSYPSSDSHCLNVAVQATAKLFN